MLKRENPLKRKPAEPKKGKPAELEGEGSDTATRQYNKHVAQHVEEQDVGQLARRAREAADGEEGEELERAEELGKQGPSAVRENASRRPSAKKGSSERRP